NPPATSTLPLGSSVAVWCSRFALTEATDQVLLPGSYNSAKDRGKGKTPTPPPPPVTSTLPLSSRVAVSPARATARSLAATQGNSVRKSPRADAENGVAVCTSPTVAVNSQVPPRSAAPTRSADAATLAPLAAARSRTKV